MHYSAKPVRPSSFTLIELLAVMAIIAILAALTLYAYSGVLKNSARSRARSEIVSYSAALESFKADNGAYPLPATVDFTSTNTYTTALPNSSGGTYQNSSALLYENLTGQTNYTSVPPAQSSGIRVYYIFKTSQLGYDDAADAGTPIYLKDPWGNSYGYFPGYTTATTTNAPNNGTGLFDLWTTGGDTTGTTNSWINNWGG